MIFPRTQHTATVLPNGKVLVTGGTADAINSAPLVQAEIYDPATGAWIATGSMHIPRYGHQATLLKNGMVLVAGGTQAQGFSIRSAELYNPATGKWIVTGSMNQAEIYFGMVALANGDALAVGSDAELYSVAKGTWSAAGALFTPLSGNTLVVLKSGAALAPPSSFSLNSFPTQIYNPRTNAWVQTYGTASRVYAETITLPDGNVITMGGCQNSCTSQEVSSTAVYVAATGKWENATPMNYGRMFFAVTLLQDGRVMVVGSDNGAGNYLPEIYTP